MIILKSIDILFNPNLSYLNVVSKSLQDVIDLRFRGLNYA